MMDDIELTQRIDIDYGDSNRDIEPLEEIGYLLSSEDERFAIKQGENVVGRADSCDIIVNDQTISREHACIEAESPTEVFLVDKDSSNKTRLGNVILKPGRFYSLQHLSVIKFGDVSFEYHNIKHGSETSADLTKEKSSKSLNENCNNNYNNNSNQVNEKESKKIDLATNAKTVRFNQDDIHQNDEDIFEMETQPQATTSRGLPHYMTDTSLNDDIFDQETQERTEPWKEVSSADEESWIADEGKLNDSSVLNATEDEDMFVPATQPQNTKANVSNQVIDETVTPSKLAADQELSFENLNNDDEDTQIVNFDLDRDSPPLIAPTTIESPATSKESPQKRKLQSGQLECSFSEDSNTSVESDILFVGESEMLDAPSLGVTTAQLDPESDSHMKMKVDKIPEDKSSGSNLNTPDLSPSHMGNNEERGYGDDGDTDVEDNFFLADTQPAPAIHKTGPPPKQSASELDTVPLDTTLEESTDAREEELKTKDVKVPETNFEAPTQAIDHDSPTEVDFDAPTQAVPNRVRDSTLASESDFDSPTLAVDQTHVDFNAPTQAIPDSKLPTLPLESNTDSPTSAGDQTRIDFDAPTQAVLDSKLRTLALDSNSDSPALAADQDEVDLDAPTQEIPDSKLPTLALESDSDSSALAKDRAQIDFDAPTQKIPDSELSTLALESDSESPTLAVDREQIDFDAPTQAIPNRVPDSELPTQALESDSDSATLAVDRVQVDFDAPTQAVDRKQLDFNASTDAIDEEVDFDSETQAIDKKKDFENPTQAVNVDNVALWEEPTQPIVHLAVKIATKPVDKGDATVAGLVESDDDIDEFGPTQPLPGSMTNHEDDELGPTQLVNNSDLGDDDLLDATQPTPDILVSCSGSKTSSQVNNEPESENTGDAPRKNRSKLPNKKGRKTDSIETKNEVKSPQKRLIPDASDELENEFKSCTREIRSSSSTKASKIESNEQATMVETSERKVEALNKGRSSKTQQPRKKDLSINTKDSVVLDKRIMYESPEAGKRRSKKGSNETHDSPSRKGRSVHSTSPKNSESTSPSRKGRQTVSNVTKTKSEEEHSSECGKVVLDSLSSETEIGLHRVSRDNKEVSKASPSSPFNEKNVSQEKSSPILGRRKKTNLRASENKLQDKKRESSIKKRKLSEAKSPVEETKPSSKKRRLEKSNEADEGEGKTSQQQYETNQTEVLVKKRGRPQKKQYVSCLAAESSPQQKVLDVSSPSKEKSKLESPKARGRSLTSSQVSALVLTSSQPSTQESQDRNGHNRVATAKLNTSESEQVMGQDQLTQRGKRGRAKKSDESPPKKRGRLGKLDTRAETDFVTQDAQLKEEASLKVELPAKEMPKRRGRITKSKEATAEEETSNEEPITSKRGRRRKEATSVELETQPQRKRGRLQKIKDDQADSIHVPSSIANETVEEGESPTQEVPVFLKRGRVQNTKEDHNQKLQEVKEMSEQEAGHSTAEEISVPSKRARAKRTRDHHNEKEQEPKESPVQEENNSSKNEASVLPKRSRLQRTKDNDNEKGQKPKGTSEQEENNFSAQEDSVLPKRGRQRKKDNHIEKMQESKEAYKEERSLAQGIPIRQKRGRLRKTYLTSEDQEPTKVLENELVEDESPTQEVPVQLKRGRGRSHKAKDEGKQEPKVASEHEEVVSSTQELPIRLKRGRLPKTKVRHTDGSENATSDQVPVEDESQTQEVPVLLKGESNQGKRSQVSEARMADKEAASTSIDYESKGRRPRVIANQEKSRKNKRQTAKVAPEDRRDDHTESLDSSITETQQTNIMLGQNLKVLFTAIEQPAYATKVVSDLGGEIVDSAFCCDVLISDKVRRTAKFLCAVARGIPVVQLKWLDDSKKKKAFQDPWKYIIKDQAGERKFCFQLLDTLQKSKNDSLLQDYKVFATNKTTPEPEIIKDLVKAAGGNYVSKATAVPKEKGFIVSSEDKKTWPKLKEKVALVSTEILLTGILQHSLDIQKHSFK